MNWTVAAALAAVTVNGTVPLVPAAVVTLTVSLPAVARLAAGMTAVSCVGLT